MFKLTIFLSILLSSFNASAIEIAAIEHDGSYVAIDLDTFEISNVGDLRRFGFIYVNGVIPGSTYESAVIVAEFFKKPAPTDRGFNHSQSTLNKLTKLNHDRSYIPKGHTINYDEQYIRWVANDPKKRIALMSAEDKKTITIYDENLQQLKQAQLGFNFQAYDITTCVNIDNDIVISGRKESLTIKTDRKQTTIKQNQLAADKTKDFRIISISNGCYALAIPHASQKQLITAQVINFETNKLQKPFSIYKRGEYALIDNGQLLLQQRLNAISIPNTPGFRMLPTEDFVLYNTQTGETIKEFKIPNQNATLKKVVKTDKGYIAILGGPKNIQFVSLETFKSLKTIKLPFKRFFVI